MLHRNPRSLRANASIDGVPSAPRGSVVVRLGWMLGGTLLMAISLMVIAGTARLTPGVADVVFWAAVIATGSLRAIDITRYDGETTRGVPATKQDLKRYLAGLAAVSVTCWTIAQAIHI